MFYNFRIELDKFDPDLTITSDDIKYFLNKAMLDFIEKRFNGANYTGRGFQQSPQIISELKPLFKVGVETTPYYPGITVPSRFKIDRIDLPSDLLYYVSATCEITYVSDSSHLEINTSGAEDVRQVVSGESSSTKYPIAKPTQADDIYQLLRDPFNKSNLDKVLIDINENNLDIYTNDISFASNVILNYIREPLEINFEGSGAGANQDCELPSFVHSDIVELAVRMFLKTENKNTN